VTEDFDTHEVTISVITGPITEVEGNAELALNIRGTCSCGCDLWGKSIQILAEDGTVVKEKPLLRFDGAAFDTGEIIVNAPFEPGEHSWTALFPVQSVAGVLHKESSTLFSIVVKPHATRVKVWQLPSTVIAGHQFKINVGAECSSGCSLAGQKIEIRDHTWAELAAAILGEEPLPDSKGLYWTEVELEAPISKGENARSLLMRKRRARPQILSCPPATSFTDLRLKFHLGPVQAFAIWERFFAQYRRRQFCPCVVTNFDLLAS